MTGLKVEICKVAAAAAVRLLSKLDLVGVVTFDAASEWWVPMRTAENKAAICDRINEIHAGGGTIMGPFPGSVYQNATLDLAKGDRLVLYTDGIIETRSRKGEFFGDDRLEAFVRGHSSDSADCIADKFIEHLIMWSGRSQERALDDDLTLIVIGVMAEPDASP